MGRKYGKILDWWIRKSFHRNSDWQPAVVAGSWGDLSAAKIPPTAKKVADALCCEESLSTKPETLISAGKESRWRAHEPPSDAWGRARLPAGAWTGRSSPICVRSWLHMSQMPPASGRKRLRAHPKCLKIPSLCFLTSHRIDRSILLLLYSDFSLV